MNVVYLIIFYAVICSCMIVFNIFATIYGKGSSKINSIKTKIYSKKIKEQLKKIEKGSNIDSEHLKYLKRKLKHGNELVIFDSVISRYRKHENKCIDAYLKDCKEIFISLMYHYDKKSNTEKAYYLSVIRDYNLLYDNKNKEIERILFESLQDESFYCRDNAYLAICKLGSPNKLCEALINISNSNKFFHNNLISNGLNIYNGNTEVLIKMLMSRFDKFRDDIKCSVIEYLSYYDSRYSKFVYSLLLSQDTDKNLKISCLRYFEYTYYKDAEKLIIKYVNEYFDTDLELCLSAVKALRNYTSKESISTITKAIYSKNFKLRNIACESLAVIMLGMDARDLEDFSLEEEVSDVYNYHIRKNMKKVVK